MAALPSAPAPAVVPTPAGGAESGAAVDAVGCTAAILEDTPEASPQARKNWPPKVRKPRPFSAPGGERPPYAQNYKSELSETILLFPRSSAAGLGYFESSYKATFLRQELPEWAKPRQGADWHHFRTAPV